MTKEERDKREAERKARMEGAPDLGGVTLPFSRSTLLRFYWAFIFLFPAWTLWNAREGLTVENFLAGTTLFAACVLPAWFWVTGRILGLPIYPVFAIFAIPTYVVPLWQGHKALADYSQDAINTAAWTMTGFLLIGMLFWQQVAVRAVGIPGKVRMIDLKKSEKILLGCVLFEVLFELLTFLLWDLAGNAFSAVRGFATAAGRMGIFVFSYRIGQGDLKPGPKVFFLSMLAVIVLQEMASLLLANVIPTLGIAFAAYTLGAGRIPWKALLGTAAAIAVLHAGKFDMRDLYANIGRATSLLDYPRFFGEWVGFGLRNMGLSVVKAGEEKREVETAKDRAALLPLMAKIQTMTPSQVPYLQGASYEFIPALLIPRILSPGKKWSHTSNMMLSLHYGILTQEGIFTTSVAFDPVMEAYANFGFMGVLALAVIMGFFLGMVTKMTINVPMLSFGFLFGVLVIGTSISSWNTMGVFVTSTWQSFLALVALSFVMMGRLENPVWKYYAMKLAEKLKLKGRDPKLEVILKDVDAVAGPVSSEDGGQMAEGGPTSLQTSPPREELRRVEEETRPVRHERPKRFVYGKAEIKRKD